MTEQQLADLESLASECVDRTDGQTITRAMGFTQHAIPALIAEVRRLRAALELASDCFAHVADPYKAFSPGERFTPGRDCTKDCPQCAVGRVLNDSN